MRTPFKRFEDQSMQVMAQQKVVLDVGGGSRFMKGMKEYEPLFINCDYKTFDVSTDYKPDIVGDIHAIPCADGSINGIICRSVLEHVERPQVAVQRCIVSLRRAASSLFRFPPCIRIMLGKDSVATQTTGVFLKTVFD